MYPRWNARYLVWQVIDRTGRVVTEFVYLHDAMTYIAAQGAKR